MTRDSQARAPLISPLPDPVIDPGADDVLVEIDGDRAVADHVAGDAAEVDVEIFELGGQRAPYCDLDAEARGPAEVVELLGTERRARDVGDQAADPDPDGRVGQNVVDRISEPQPRGRQPVVPDLAIREAGWRRDRAADGGRGDIDLPAQHERTIGLHIVAEGAA